MSFSWDSVLGGAKDLVSSLLDDFSIDDIPTGIKTLFTTPDGRLDTNLLGVLGGLAGQATGAFDPNIQKVGYTGGIPSYAAVQERVPMPQDPNRRPGSGGRRYFSDMYFAKPENTQTPTQEAARQQAVAQAQQIASQQLPQQGMASGGLATLAKGRYLRGGTDGMEDKLPASIEGKQRAALSHGEFVIPADVVSHLGNGNSEAGAKQLYAMMDRIRQARTGTKKQGKQVNPSKYMPA
jgi:hypothetical protein